MSDPLAGRLCHFCDEPVTPAQPAKVLVSGWVDEYGGGLVVDEDRPHTFPVTHEVCIPDEERL